MLLKWITCTVPPETRESFSQAQSRWAPLQTVPGFLGQLGGWNHFHPTDAQILAFWQDEESYGQFMRHWHDPLYQQTGQAGTYSAITITHLTAELDPALLPSLFAQPWLIVSRLDEASLPALSPNFTLTGTGDIPLHFAWANDRPELAETSGSSSALIRLKDKWRLHPCGT